MPPTPTANIRFVNVSLGQTVSTIFIAGQPVFTNLAYLQSTPYLSVTAGAISLVAEFSPSLASFLVFPFLEANRDYTALLAPSDDGAYTAIVYPDQNACCKTPRFRFINFAFGASDGVSLIVDNLTIYTGVITPNAGFPVYLETTPCSFIFKVVSTFNPATVLIPDTQVQFEKGTVYTLITVRNADDTAYEFLVLANPCRKH